MDLINKSNLKTNQDLILTLITENAKIDILPIPATQMIFIHFVFTASLMISNIIVI